MIPFFRKIRKKLADDNKPLKYLRYAIGEIVLVVIGILIALQINNWNESRKTQQRLTDFFTEIQNNLSGDIIKANFIIDNYIEEDSILRNIKFNKVNYTLDKFTENRRSFTFIFDYENLRLQTKGFDGLVKNIDNIPVKYGELMELLNEIYISNNYDLVTLNQRIQSITYANKDNFKNKDWSGTFWDLKFNDNMIKYFQSDIYKNDARHYFNEKKEFILRVIRFKIDAIDAYKEIAKVNNSDIPIPEHVNYTFPDPDILSQFAGDYQIEYEEIDDGGDKCKFLIEENQLKWHYAYKDVNYNEEFNVPLYWHKNKMFFNYSVALIWEFGKTNEGNMRLTHRVNGSKNQYIKIDELAKN